MPAKPFNTNYRIPLGKNYVVLNGDQITKIEAIQQLDAFGLAATPEAWRLIFFLSDGTTQEIRPSQWTSDFVNDVFKGA